MDTTAILSELKRIRASSNCRPAFAIENDISRLIAKLESSSEVDRELESLFQGHTLTSLDMKLSYQLVRENNGPR